MPWVFHFLSSVSGLTSPWGYFDTKISRKLLRFMVVKTWKIQVWSGKKCLKCVQIFISRVGWQVCVKFSLVLIYRLFLCILGSLDGLYWTVLEGTETTKIGAMPVKPINLIGTKRKEAYTVRGKIQSFPLTYKRWCSSRTCWVSIFPILNIFVRPD